MSVHVLGGGVSHDVSSPFKGAAVNRCSKGIVYDERHTMFVGNACKLLNVEHIDARIGDCFAEQTFRIGAESLADFFLRCICIHECTFNAQFFHGYGKQIECTSVNGRRADKMVAGFTDVEHCIEVGSLTGRSQHGTYSSFEGCNLGCYGIIGRILQAGIEIAAVFQIEQAGHLFAGVIFKGCTLINGQDARFAFLRSPSCLYAECLFAKFIIHNAIMF